MEDINITLTVSEEGLERILSIVSKYFESSVIQNKSFINNIIKRDGQESAYNRDGQEICINPIDKQNVENNVEYIDTDKTIDTLNVENNDKSIDLNTDKYTPNSIIECTTVHPNKENIIAINNKASGVSSNMYIKPDINEIGKYIRDTGSTVSPTKFYNYYEERDWTDFSGEKITDWRAKVDSWTRRDRKSYSKTAPVKVIPPFVPTEFDDGKN